MTCSRHRSLPRIFEFGGNPCNTVLHTSSHTGGMLTTPIYILFGRTGVSRTCRVGRLQKPMYVPNPLHLLVCGLDGLTYLYTMKFEIYPPSLESRGRGRWSEYAIRGSSAEQKLQLHWCILSEVSACDAYRSVAPMARYGTPDRLTRPRAHVRTHTHTRCHSCNAPPASDATSSQCSVAFAGVGYHRALRHAVLAPAGIRRPDGLARPPRRTPSSCAPRRTQPTHAIAGNAAPPHENKSMMSSAPASSSSCFALLFFPFAGTTFRTESMTFFTMVSMLLFCVSLMRNSKG